MLCLQHTLKVMLCLQHTLKVMLCLQHTLKVMLCLQHTLKVMFCLHRHPGAGRSSEVERSLMVRWVVGSILHGVDPLSYFSFQPVLHNWCNKGRGMCYPVCGMVHIKEPLLLIDKSSICVLNHMSDAI